MLAEKYYAGRYAICKACSCRPCVCEAPAAPAGAPVALKAHGAGGNVIPFALWDYVIPSYALTAPESCTLAYLCRATMGYGLHAGAELSIAQIAHCTALSARTVQRALSRLEDLQLIRRERQREEGRREHARTLIAVTLPAPEVRPR